MDQAASVSAVLRERLAALGEAPYLEFERRELPTHHVPPRIALLDELPRLPSLKTSLRQVRELGSLTLRPPGSSPPPAPSSTAPNSSKLSL